MAQKLNHTKMKKNTMRMRILMLVGKVDELENVELDEVEKLDEVDEVEVDEVEEDNVLFTNKIELII